LSTTEEEDDSMEDDVQSKLKSKLELGFNVDRSRQPRAPAEAGYNRPPTPVAWEPIVGFHGPAACR